MIALAKPPETGAGKLPFPLNWPKEESSETSAASLRALGRLQST